jgi:hypothetical protein
MESAMATRTTLDQTPSGELPNSIKIVGLILRTIFMASLLIIAAHVSAPQNVGPTWLDLPVGDVVRAALGFAFCLWVLVHIFILPKDPAAYRTWAYMGAVLVPLAVICGFAIW